MRTLILICFLFVVSFAWTRDDKANNWSGIDTANTSSLYAKYDTIKYSKAFRLTDHENIRVILKANDTSTAGFKDDSIGVELGFRTICPCYNSSNVADTCADILFPLDTLDSTAMANFAAGRGYLYNDGTYTRSTHVADTLMCSGYAVLSKQFAPEWDAYIQFYVKGIGKNKKTVAVPCKLDVQRRQYVNVRSK